MIGLDQLVLVPCPLCREHDKFLPVDVPDGDEHISGYGQLYAGLTKSQWRLCGRCGFVHQNPRPTKAALDRYYLDARYRRQRTLPPVERYRQFAEWYYGDKVRYVETVTGVTRGKVFDVGCGYGAALAVFLARGWGGYGVEADMPCCDYARDQLGIQNVQNGLLTEEAEPAGEIDVVFSNHAFEHFADLDQVMQGVRRLLKPGGYLVTVVPTYFSNRSNLSKRWMNSAHYSLFTHLSLARLCEKFGLETLTYTYRGWKTEIDELWHVARFTGRAPGDTRYSEAPARVDRYLRVINPLRSALYFPFYAYHSERRQLRENLGYGWNILRRSPSEFFRKALGRLRRGWLRTR